MGNEINLVKLEKYVFQKSKENSNASYDESYSMLIYMSTCIQNHRYIVQIHIHIPLYSFDCTLIIFIFKIILSISRRDLLIPILQKNLILKGGLLLSKVVF